MAPRPAFKDIIALCNAGRLVEAESAALALTTAQPEDAVAHNLLGAVRAQQNNPAAIADFHAAIALKPAWDEPHANLGLFYTQQGNFSAARDAWRAALALEPGKAATAINLGNALRELGALDEAETAYRTALGLGPEPLRATAYSNLGTVFFTREDYANAADCFRRAAEIQPDFTAAILNLGRVLDRGGHFEEAESALRRALALSPQSYEAHVMLGHVLLHQERHEEAVDAYREAMALNPADREAASGRGALLLKLGRHGEALAALAAGPGIVSLSLAPQFTEKAAPPRVTIPGGPHFIGAWTMNAPRICDDLIAFFESRSGHHLTGHSTGGVNRAVKDSTDLTVEPADLDAPAFAPVRAYLNHLEACAADYAQAWPVFGSMFTHVDVAPFNIQRYAPGGHFQRVHAERMSFAFVHRVMAWMTYLNDVDEGGETVFDHYGIAVKPERGKTLIWPAEWTHAHHGGVVKAGVQIHHHRLDALSTRQAAYRASKHAD